MKTLVLGLGNELYGDDGIGIHIVRLARDSLKTHQELLPDEENINFKECSLSGLALLDVIVDCDNLVIIDTIKRTNPVTGKIRVFDVTQLRHIPGPSPHYVSVPQTIEIGKTLGLKVPSQIKIIAVEAKNMYNLGEGLSPKMKEAIPKIIQELKSLLKELHKT
jgi:hydrogenase maturation protease